ncbi:putative secreted protein (Por secretion system target) [Flavobacterium araucananum]|uniref:Carbohydrate-binding protein n=1 Tax=Flavobacterium araucananum TaxID=946678 RepID=A0A227PGM9_9FLAO|nr:beta-1,3-glucanase family protein [Flavobacterium araucananum]OXG08982.1 carbohydrate-binding protein [Flavobacterium araucananum]PWJ99837.1 putative secreted protein (Por secretion system target) [Flavobacterium araucananum]
MRNFRLQKNIFTVLLLALLGNFMYGQGPVPFTISNTSTFNDNELYVAIVGIDYNTGNHVWVNAKTSQVLPMSSSYNTITGPTIGGNTGPGQNSKYANCFTKLSEIPNKTFTLPQIAGCRVFIAKGQQLYFYFFGASGAPSGYTSPNPLNATDPNQGILYEIIELTNNQYGFFGNPSRVDSYKYPMGLELFGANGYQKKVGELKKHADIVAAFKANVPSEFQGCVNDATGEITAPSKTPAFADGTGGTSVGAQANYLKSYIDAIWNKYKNEDLIFYAGDAGVFKGRVIGEQLEVVGQSGGFVGRTGRVQNRPSTQEALEGKGVLDRRLVDGDLDLVVQAQLTAAINRHVVNVTTANPGQQNWYDASKFYQVNPTNHYSKFWHLPGISVDNLAYGFAYDDVADQSPSLHTPQPTKVIASFGGYAGTVPSVPATTDVITVYKDCNYTGFSGGLTIGDYNLARLKTLGIEDDAISSLKITQGFQAILYQDDNFGGASTVINSDNTCLNTTWNDKVTSIRILANGVTTLGNQTFFLQNRNSNLYMDVWGASLSNGAAINQGALNSGNNQKFTLTHLGDGLYKIIANHSGQSLDVNNFNKANGTPVQQYPYNATTNQQFVLVATGDGFYKIVARHSGRIVEVAGASTANGAIVQQWDNNNQTCGQWKLIPATTSQTAVLIQAEDYSSMSGIQVEATTDTGGGSNVGYTETGDWLAYNSINFPTTGSYLIEYRVASGVTGGRLSSDLNGGTIVLGNVDIPNTGGWQNWQTVSQTVNVNAGTYNFGIYIQNTGMNINWIKITKVGAGLTAKTAAPEAETEQVAATVLNLYPSPVENTLYITTDVTGGNVSIVDSQTGAVVSGQKVNNNSLDVSHLRRGVYLLVFEKDGTKTVKRFIKK